jgi:pimeloyl-ACP methyl ester carboxylesterase
MARLDPFRSPQLRARFIEKYDAIVADWPVPCHERDVRTEFGSTHVIVSGPESAPPLVLLHGASTTALMWRPVIERLSTDYRCYCVDTIVEGNKSMLTRRLIGKTRLLTWLREVFVALGVGNARVVGLSYGGWMAANLASQSPGLVNRLVLLCPAATLAPIVGEFYRRVFSATLRHSPERAREFVNWLSTTPTVVADPVVDLAMTGLVSGRNVPPGVAPPSVLSDDALRRIQAPTTVVIGDREVIYRGGPHAALARAQRLIPEVSTHLVAGANHMLFVDCPESLNDLLVEALA